jgi:pyruvate dehydrogenase E1 component
MYENQEDIFYYLTLGNEPYPMPALPEGSEEGILKGIYQVSAGPPLKSGLKVQLLGSGSILREALRAQDILATSFGVSSDVWSATSYKELRREALEVDRWNMLHPTAAPRKSYIASVLEDAEGPIIAASDYMKILPDMIRPWTKQPLVSLGTDGFGRSDTREALRRHFEVDAESIAIAALHSLSIHGDVSKDDVEKAIRALGVNPEKADPVSCGPATSYSRTVDENE